MDKVAAARLLPCAERRAAPRRFCRASLPVALCAALHAAAAQAKQFREEHKAPLALLRQKVPPRRSTVPMPKPKPATGLPASS